MKTKYVEVSNISDKLEAYSFKDIEFDTEVNVAIFGDGSGIVIQGLFDPEDPQEVAIDVADIEKLKTILRYALEKCKYKAEAVQNTNK